MSGTLIFSNMPMYLSLDISNAVNISVTFACSWLYSSSLLIISLSFSFVHVKAFFIFNTG